MREAIFGSFAFFAILAWIAVEFLGFILWLRAGLRRIGFMPPDGHDSVDVTVRSMDEWPYAATRNASQHRNGNGGKHGKG